MGSPADLSGGILDVYDTEVLQIETVRDALVEAFVTLDYTPDTVVDVKQAFVNECIGLFAEIGFVAVVSFEAGFNGAMEFPSIELVGRVKDHEFDTERQTWEVQHDVLGIDETPGAIKSDGSIKSLPKSTAFITPKE